MPSTSDSRSTVNNNNDRLNDTPRRSYRYSTGNLFRAPNLFRAGKLFRAGRTFYAETPVSLGIRLPLAIPERLITYLPRKGGYPQTRGGGGGVVTPPSDLPETSVSPTRVSAVVTGMFHMLRTVTIRHRRTLPDSAGLPPGLYSSNMCPSNKTTPHSERLSAPLLRHRMISHYVSQN